MIKKLSLFGLLVTFLSCNDRDPIILLQQPQSIIISNDDDNDQIISTRDLLEDVTYITLETDEFILAKAGKILEFNNRILISDLNKKVLVAYDTSGHFLGQIGRKGYGPEEYKVVSDFDVDSANERLIIFSRDDSSFLVYDKNLRFQEKVKIDIWAFYMSILDNGLLAFYSSFEEDLNGQNVSIYDLNGKKLKSFMPFPPDGSYVPMDYTGFLKDNFYTYPLSSIIYSIDYEDNLDRPFVDIAIPNQRDESKKFDQTSFLGPEWMKTQILSDFTVGRDRKELLFYYSIFHRGVHTYSLGLKLESGQVFGHADMKHGIGKDRDVMSLLFFVGPYGLPDYSENSEYYYACTSGDSMYWYFSLNKDNSQLNEAKDIDPKLYNILKGFSDDQEHTVLMKFKLKSSHE